MSEWDVDIGGRRHAENGGGTAYHRDEAIPVPVEVAAGTIAEMQSYNGAGKLRPDTADVQREVEPGLGSGLEPIKSSRTTQIARLRRQSYGGDAYGCRRRP